MVVLYEVRLVLARLDVGPTEPPSDELIVYSARDLEDFSLLQVESEATAREYFEVLQKQVAGEDEDESLRLDDGSQRREGTTPPFEVRDPEDMP